MQELKHWRVLKKVWVWMPSDAQSMNTYFHAFVMDFLTCKKDY